MADKRNQNQIIRKDGKNCFVESVSDSFEIGEAHLVFAAYDLSKPAGERQTNNINIYIDISEIFEICRKMASGEFRKIVREKKEGKDSLPVFAWLGGTTAEKLNEYGKARKDGKCLSRVAKLLCGTKTDFMFIADSGPGEQDENGLIVPKFGRNPENHVVVSMRADDFSELMLMTKVHYEAWLTARYVSLRKQDA